MKTKRITRNKRRGDGVIGPGADTFLFSAEEGGLRFGKQMKYRPQVSPKEFQEAWRDWYGVRVSPRIAKTSGITKDVVRKAHLRFIKGFLRGLRGQMGVTSMNPKKSLWAKLKNELGWVIMPGPGLLDEAVELGVLANPLPPRSYDTMSEAIALSSPSGRMSKRARAAAQKKLGESLFGEGGLVSHERPKESEREHDLRWAKEYRGFAERGMSVRKYTKLAEELEKKWGVANPKRKKRVDWIARFNQVFKGQMKINYSLSLDQWYAQDWGGEGGQKRLLINFPGEYEGQQRRAAEKWAEEQLSAGMPSPNPHRVKIYHLRRRVA